MVPPCAIGAQQATLCADFLFAFILPSELVSQAPTTAIAPATALLLLSIIWGQEARQLCGAKPEARSGSL